MEKHSLFFEPGHPNAVSTEQRAALLLEAVRAQVAFAHRHVPFWADRLQKHGLPPTLDSLEEFAALPPMTKAELRVLSPWDLLPDASRSRLYLCRATSGTTGVPASFFWTRPDWQALAMTLAALLETHRPRTLLQLVAFNGYHQGHLMGPAYDDGLRQMGATVIPRHYLADDEASTVQQIETFGCNTLVLAQRSGLKKSGKTVEDLLRHEPELFRRHGIRWWIGSSSTFTPELREHACEQGATVTNLYGSSEFGTLGIACREHPEEFHLALGHVYVEIVDVRGRPVTAGHRGRVVITRLLGYDQERGAVPQAGSQLLRLDNGDEALLVDTACTCGLTTPRIRDIGRGGAAGAGF
ncbi:phenylacetate--CoA ligase family protein [Gloeobacter violaceus]|uniref:Gll3162 protein n=1 Tax=Gloeobacter violaceus (strain ATCC 29082 / PCC 7421) TaxID=251221 RepID=Q7NGK7_GLOVI|nr:phenylacetate--CoA ligase family protein [Gloeobacter violaceus]BAC91103.1 gll3162 [Gloeobacter violaceus PCC 7421]